MDYEQAREALYEYSGCSGWVSDEKPAKDYFETINRKVKKIIDEHPSLLNEGLDSLGYTALILASVYDNIEIIEVLLTYNNLDINKRSNHGSTALHRACSRGHKEIVKLLLSHNNLDINIQDKDGSTALHRACYKGRTAITKLLLSHKNIDINIQDKHGYLARDVCCTDGRVNSLAPGIILDLLENHNNPLKFLPSPKVLMTKNSKRWKDFYSRGRILLRRWREEWRRRRRNA